jgi:type IV pilus assembly protein PilB
MYNSDFKIYLSDQTELDFELISELFEKNENVFDVAFKLIEDYGIDTKFLGKIWGDYIGFAYVDPNSTIINQEYLQKVGIDFIKENNAIPMYKFGKAITVSTSNPQNPYIQDMLEKKLGEIVSFVFCFPFDIEIYLKLNNLKQEKKC